MYLWSLLSGSLVAVQVTFRFHSANKFRLRFRGFAPSSDFAALNQSKTNHLEPFLSIWHFCALEHATARQTPSGRSRIHYRHTGYRYSTFETTAKKRPAIFRRHSENAVPDVQIHGVSMPPTPLCNYQISIPPQELRETGRTE